MLLVVEEEGGGGGGSGSTTNDDTVSNGRGYGFGFEIGSIEGINLAKKMMSRRTNETSSTGSGDKNPLNLSEHLLNEEWAIQVAEYIWFIIRSSFDYKRLLIFMYKRNIHNVQNRD